MSERDDHVLGLRQVADFLEAHPDLPLPCPGSMNAFANNKEEIVKAARTPGIRWSKGYISDYFSLIVEFAGGYSYEINIERGQVCRRVVVGTHIKAAEPEKIVEDVEWICDEPLMAVSR